MKKYLDLLVVLFIMGLIAFIAGNLSGCQTKPPDLHVCVEMSLDRGECIRAISGQKVRVDEIHELYDKTWWESRPTNIILPLQDFMALKKWIIDLCKRNKGMCEKEISSWDRNLESIEQTVQEKQSHLP